MEVDSKTATGADSPGSAQNHVSIGPVPEWVVRNSIYFPFKTKDDNHLTYLLLDQQVNAEKRQYYYKTAVRLETMQAVQHWSQWHLEFEPRVQSITLHSIKIHRGDDVHEHANIEKVRVLQRETNLERFVIDGFFTALLVLEDVRPGDVLESCYTIEVRPRLLTDRCCYMFSVPSNVPVGVFHFSARFKEGRCLKWKSASSWLTPVEKTENGETLLSWNGERIFPGKPEVNTPSWHIGNSWVQVSDCEDWNVVAKALSDAWGEHGEDEAIVEVVNDITAAESETLARIEKALRLIQDEYRYLSVNLEFGGHVPTPPGTVARRRYGDCKDLSFLLAQLLQKMGVPARAILVNTLGRKSVTEMLPMPGLFNHAVVEFEVNGEKRWVDATMKLQGGGPLDRFIPDYVAGLPVDKTATSLVASPKNAKQENLYELKESLLLDTTGAPSYLAIVVHAKGCHAESLRQHIGTDGEEAVAKERLQNCANKFRNAKRSGPMQYRYDRDTNEFHLAEVFEVNGFLMATRNPKLCSVPLMNNLVMHMLIKPESGERKTPFAVPFPCNLVHTTEVQSSALKPFSMPKGKVDTRFMQFSRDRKSLNSFWSMTLSLRTLVDGVQPAEYAEYRKTVEEIHHESNWSLQVPVGFAHPKRRSDFGALPLPPRKAVPVTPVQVQAPVPGVVIDPQPAAIATGQQTELFATSSGPVKERLADNESKSKKRRRRGRDRGRKGLDGMEIIVVGAVIVVIVVLIIYGYFLTHHG